MLALRRHQLVRLTETGWAAVQSLPWDEPARACLAQWATHRLPLVVTQQRAGLPPSHVALGLPAPLQWRRRRIALHVPLSSVLYFDDFPTAAAVAALLSISVLTSVPTRVPTSIRDGWLSLAAALTELGAAPRVYGSFGWQQLTGLPYLHADSDLDLHLSVSDARAADVVADALSRAPFAKPRLDGELVFFDGSAVAWREWCQWRAGRVEKILVKRLTGVAMEAGTAWLGERQTC